MLYILMLLGLPAMLGMADNYIDDVYYWPYSKSVSRPQNAAVSQPEVRSNSAVQQVPQPDTVWIQPADTVVKLIIRK